MPLMTTGKCWRGCGNRYGIASVEGMPDDVTEEELDTLGFTPKSYVCCGIVDPEARVIPQDAYCMCFVNDAVDQTSMNDEQDLAHVAYVIATAQAVLASRRVNSGKVGVLQMDGSIAEVETMQKGA